MKSIKELEVILRDELRHYISNIENKDEKYYNQFLGDASVILTAIIDFHLRKSNKWNLDKWLDDSLITKVKKNDNFIFIWGIVIWGKVNTTVQWTEPFYFKIRDKSESEYNILFGDKNLDPIRYSDFLNERDVWDNDYYSNSSWDPMEREWDFTINKIL